MILLTAVAAGFLITYVRAKLTRRKLQLFQIEIPWLVFYAVIPQVLMFQIPAVGKYILEAYAPLILVGSQALLFVFVLANITQPGFWVLGIGLAANLLVIAANGGWMPISPETVRRILPALPSDFPLADRRLGLSKDWIIPLNETRLPLLSDRFTLPEWISYRVAFSVGDVLIAIGAILLLWSLSNPGKTESK